MEIFVNNLKGSQSYSGTTWTDFAWRTFLLGFYNSTNPDAYRFIRLDNWSWTSSGCGTWINETSSGQRNSSDWWSGLNESQVKALYASGNMGLDIRITKVGTNMFVAYAIRHNGSEYRQYYKFTNMPTKLSMFYSSEDASYTINNIKLGVKDGTGYSIVGSTTGTGTTYGVGSGWNDYRNLFDLPRLSGNFTLTVDFTMDGMKNGDTTNSATVQPAIYTPGNLYKRIVTRYDWCINSENSFATSTTTCDGKGAWLWKCTGTGWDGAIANGGFDADGTTFRQVVDSADCRVEIKRSGSTISVKMWILPTGKSQRYGVWFTAEGCTTGIVGFRLTEQSSTYVVNSYSIT